MKNRMSCLWCALATGALAAAVLMGGSRACAADPPAAPPEAKPASAAPAAQPSPPAVSQREPQILLGLSEVELKIEKALYAPTKLELAEVPLRDVVEFLKELHGIPVVVDRAALQESGIAEDLPITFSAKEISLRSALGLMLKGSNLDWLVRDETLLITTQQLAAAELCTRAYDLAPLMQDVEDPSELQEIVRVIHEALERPFPAAPEVIGDAAAANALPRKVIQHRYLLVVRDNRAAQDEVQRMLITLLEAKAALPEPKPRPMLDPSLIPGLPMLPTVPRVLPAPTDN